MAKEKKVVEKKKEEKKPKGEFNLLIKGFGIDINVFTDDIAKSIEGFAKPEELKSVIAFIVKKDGREAQVVMNIPQTMLVLGNSTSRILLASQLSRV